MAGDANVHRGEATTQPGVRRVVRFRVDSRRIRFCQLLVRIERKRFGFRHGSTRSFKRMRMPGTQSPAALAPIQWLETRPLIAYSKDTIPDLYTRWPFNVSGVLCAG